MSRKRRSLIGGGGPVSLTPDVEPPDDESAVRTEPFRPADDSEASLLSGRLDTPGESEGTSEDPGVAAVTEAPGDGAPSIADPGAPAEAPPAVVEPAVVAQAEAPSVLLNQTPAPASLNPAFEEKEEWFLKTGAPAQSREAAPELAPELAAEPVTAPNPQVYVFALLVAVALGAALLLVVYALFA